MLTKNMHKDEVEEFLKGKGDFIQIDNLNHYLKLMPPIDMKKFAYLKLTEIYRRKNMFEDVAKSYRNAAMNSTIFREKIEYFVEETKAHIRKVDFMEADKAIKRAFSEATMEQKKKISEEIKEFYKKVASEFEKELKRNQASRIYEKMLKLNFSDQEKTEIKTKLIKLYEKLGKVREIKMLEGI